MVHKHFLIFYGFPLHCVDTIYIYSFSRKGGRPWVAPVLVFKRAEETLEAAPWYPAHCWVASWVASFGLNCACVHSQGYLSEETYKETLRKPILYLLQ